MVVMTRMVQWLVIGILACGLLGCGKREAKVVKPSGSGVGSGYLGGSGGHHLRTGSARGDSFGAPAPDGPSAGVGKVSTRVLQQAVDNLVVRQLVKAEMERSDILISQADIEVAKELQQTLGEGGRW